MVLAAVWPTGGTGGRWRLRVRWSVRLTLQSQHLLQLLQLLSTVAEVVLDG